ncbi:DNA-3-methyladenine glycosylase I [Vagococcus carniphilus]|uniref:DNA-3-methyladenine glycosylase I n=1 Tax=Vagococcus carniphilus TaxID=218144 RepID=A0AAW8U9S5_9ENTE|nr:DNA-3-methyladenine glycosylase I [Vagococcus carniphilus]MDT2829590.1 DNA-3-methyladenine glycosylase I [Vagococcus carniphilus]MDT2833708.1 DNA-3-methyladenine glycosylase I [Vagococcus carniphilus]MDT2839049.1 DNA-3-methyladenine glycosylase I [Vagococcus carniphilus]MDT2847661.1 DNA-3-methyladenine glycosylase I [Vagococcus carniphilus]MDT2853107.1 DNA-3-methyladenine glycosylase I [Vagococcus carniphilus]
MAEEICPWALRSELELEYHDKAWGFPLHDDAMLFEMLVLETMQAGLSWTTILKKREGMKQAFDQFNPTIIQSYQEDKIAELLQDESIIRNKLKVNATISNAAAFLAVQKQHGSFDSFIWSYVDNQPIQNKFKTIEDVPAHTPLAEQISKDLKKLGFKFIGPTTVYAFMQSIGMVNDHLVTCPIHQKAATHV